MAARPDRPFQKAPRESAGPSAAAAPGAPREPPGALLTSFNYNAWGGGQRFGGDPAALPKRACEV